MHTIVFITMLLLASPDRIVDPFPVKVLVANNDIYLMWDNGKINYYPGGIKRKVMVK